MIFKNVILFAMGENETKSNFPVINQGEPSLKPSFRDYIALSMIILSVGLLIITTVIGFGVISKLTDNGEKFNDIKELFGILLPLIGTWVGTVMAYYFSKDNFVAANQSVRDLVRQVTSTEEKLQGLKVKDVMVKPEIFPYKTVDKLESFDKSDIKIQELIDLMNDTNSERLPILEKDTLKFVFLFYRTTLERFQLGYKNSKIKLANKRAPKEDELTVKDVFESDFRLMKDIVELTKKKKFLQPESTLAEVRQMMLDNTVCQDVFITKTGNKDEKVEGWITNTIIIEKAELFKKAGTNF
jgi:CBS domain-containing protein